MPIELDQCPTRTKYTDDFKRDAVRMMQNRGTSSVAALELRRADAPKDSSIDFARRVVTALQT